MSTTSLVGPPIAHRISLELDDPRVPGSQPVMSSPVAARGSAGQERLATEFIASLRDSLDTASHPI